MTRVDFYTIKSDQPQARLAISCRLIQKAFGLGHRVHVHTGAPGLSRQLDELLWTFRDDAFIPHGINPQDPDMPVSIGHDRIPPTARDLLLNLADTVPEGYQGFARVAEIVNEDPVVKQAGRHRYRYYREQGYDLHHHPLG
ncbi:DNA polymerase III, chi subunit [Ectothiorhodospira magna]|uniref:DNA polymerase III, chi subunit n=1 Tax=Ectothiorhodospira magna TaxID=867345 RepID=A0A1H8YW17_9GAMM|nr:DNA polymerase III subunit chi [Ectothiorhodospira magna]SEP56415.1 DNA polymerase III, chi subunit [Ectothiorhodospira magna]